MEAVEILFSGRKFENLEKAPMSDEDKLATQAIAADIGAALQSLREDIEQEGGHVTIDVSGPTMFQIATDGLSDKLKEKVHDALRPR